MKPTPELLEVIEQWNRAEKSIKISEQITGRVAIPSVMELRYAGRRVVDAFNAFEIEDDEVLAVQYLVDAKFDCLRAQHDALDISVNFIAGFVDEALRGAEPNSLSEHYEELEFFIGAIESLQKKIVVSREDRSRRQEVYDSVHEDLVDLQIRFQKLKVSLVEMFRRSDQFSKLDDKRGSVLRIASRARRDDMLFKVTAVIATVLASLAAALSLLV